MAEVILVRHGETDANRELRFQGQVDVALNPTGLEQAKRVAARLAGEAAQALYCSDLLRARQTADAISAAMHMAPLALPALREQAFGILDGMRVDDIQREHPGAWEAWLRFDEDASPEGGETAREFHARVMDALHRIAADHRGERVVVVTHGGVLDMVYRSATAQSLSGPRVSEIPNAGINRVRMRSGAVQILRWGEVDHLADLPPQPVYDQRRFSASR